MHIEERSRAIAMTLKPWAPDSFVKTFRTGKSARSQEFHAALSSALVDALTEAVVIRSGPGWANKNAAEVRGIIANVFITNCQGVLDKANVLAAKFYNSKRKQVAGLLNQELRAQGAMSEGERLIQDLRVDLNEFVEPISLGIAAAAGAAAYATRQIQKWWRGADVQGFNAGKVPADKIRAVAFVLARQALLSMETSGTPVNLDVLDKSRAKITDSGAVTDLSMPLAKAVVNLAVKCMDGHRRVNEVEIMIGELPSAAPRAEPKKKMGRRTDIEFPARTVEGSTWGGEDVDRTIINTPSARANKRLIGEMVDALMLVYDELVADGRAESTNTVSWPAGKDATTIQIFNIGKMKNEPDRYKYHAIQMWIKPSWHKHFEEESKKRIVDYDHSMWRIGVAQEELIDMLIDRYGKFPDDERNEEKLERLITLKPLISPSS